MARPLRLEYPGAVYHVVARGNERREIFRDDSDRELYLSRVRHYRERFGFRLYAYCLMTNHLHLALETGQVPLSRVMLGIHGSYTQAFNRRHRRAGHLFQGRYKAFLVQKDRYLLALIRYIHENPVKAKIVGRAAESLWSSDPYYRKGQAPDWLDIDLVLGMLGPRRGLALRSYRALVGGETGETYENLESIGQIVKGDEEFAKRAFQEAGEPNVQKTLSVESVARAAADALDVKLKDMRSRQRHRKLSQARALAGYAGRELGGIPLAKTAAYFGRDGSTLVRDVGRLEDELRKKRDLAAAAAAVLRRLK